MQSGAPVNLAPRSSPEELELLEEEAAPSGPRCVTCPMYRASTQDVVKLRAVGGTPRGACTLAPIVVYKEELDVCGSHPEISASRAAAHAAIFASVLDPMVKRILETLERLAKPLLAVEGKLRKDA